MLFWKGREVAMVATTPAVKQPNPRGKKKKPGCKSHSAPSWITVLSAGRAAASGTGGALEGLLGWVVVECCWHVWPLLQLVILQVKFLRDAGTVW